MDSNKLKAFYYSGITDSGEPQYGFAEFFVLSAVYLNNSSSQRLSASFSYKHELSADAYKNVFLLDTKLVYKLNKRIVLSGMLNNIFNQRTYNYTTYSQL